MMTKKTSVPVKTEAPFQKSVEHSMALRNIDLNTALGEIQLKYEDFINRNQKLIERQNDHSNRAQIQLISHFAILATLSLTVTGFLLTQTTQVLTDPQKNLILIILSSQTASLFFGAMDYWQTIRFHARWARMYQDIDKEVHTKVDTGEIQYINDLGKIETKHLKDQPEETKKWVTILMVACCLSGLALLILLFYAYFYNVPFWTN